ncbi:MAG: hypothetical protein ACXAC7_08170 [Candidatus Hodarchaeales archaeon]
MTVKRLLIRKFDKKMIFICSIFLLSTWAAFSANNKNVLASPSEDIPIDQEYATGKLIGDFLNLTYTWIKTPQTSFISISIYDEIYKVAPFRPFFGQSYVINETEVFVGTVINGFELFDDSNNNNVLDQFEELKYYVMLNASQQVINSELSVEDIDTNHRKYSWKTSYLEIDGFLFPHDELQKAIIDSVNLSYAFEVTNETSELKLTVEMGEWDAYKFDFVGDDEVRIENLTLDDLSLSILYGTTVGSAGEITPEFISTGDVVSEVALRIGNQVIFQSFFNDTYKLLSSGEIYNAQTVIAEDETLFDDQILSWGTPDDLLNWWNEFAPSISELPSIPPLDINNALYLYRVCYPTWRGDSFEHDPRYLAHFKPTADTPTQSETGSSSTISTTSFTSGTSGTSDTSDTEFTNTTKSTTGPTDSTGIPGFIIYSLLILPLLVYWKRKR